MDGRWALAIDFGTTATAAAYVVGNDEPRLVRFEDDAATMPSCVYRTHDGEIVAGLEAERELPLDPLRGVRTPKAKLRKGHEAEELGDESVALVFLVAAVLRRAYRAACEQVGGEPEKVALTCPVAWPEGGMQRDALTGAYGLAGIGKERVIFEEPVAAAYHVAGEDLPLDGVCAIYDLGGGTCDFAVMRRDGEGLRVLARDEEVIGGENFDEHLYFAVLEQLEDREAAARLEELYHEPGWIGDDHSDEGLAAAVKWRRCAADVLANARRAKETLSAKDLAHVLVPPPVGAEVSIPRARFVDLVAADLETTVEDFEACITEGLGDAGAEKLAAVYLVGGSSRIPAVADAVRLKLGVEPLLADDPKGAIALGAAHALGRQLGLGPRPRPKPDDPRLYREVGSLLAKEHYAAADRESIAILRNASGHETFDTKQKADAIPDEVLRRLHALWLERTGDGLSGRAWITRPSAELTNRSNGGRTWLEHRCEELGLSDQEGKTEDDGAPEGGDPRFTPLRRALAARDFDKADRLSMAIIRTVSGHDRITNLAQARDIPGDVLGTLYGLWAGSGQPLRKRDWVMCGWRWQGGLLCDYVSWSSAETWLERRLAELNL